MLTNKDFLKFVCFISVFLLICFVFVGCENKEMESTDVFNTSDDSILYNNAYDYTLNNKNIFLLKERGYDFVENYNGEEVKIAKKEMLIVLNIDNTSQDYLMYEIFENNNFVLKGVLYKEGNYYYSNLILNNMGEFLGEISVKILNNKEEELYNFILEEV